MAGHYANTAAAGAAGAAGYAGNVQPDLYRGVRSDPATPSDHSEVDMTTLPWMPVFPGDELAETLHLSCEEYGAYALLKMALWQHGAIANDDDRLARITRLSLEKWLSVRATIEPLFGPKWSHAKLEHHRSLAAGQREKKSAAGKKGALGRWREHGKANAVANGKGNGTAIAENGKAIGSDIGEANADANGLQPQMKNSAYEKEVLPHAHPHARETFTTKLQAGEWLKVHTDLFPGSEEFDSAVEAMLRGKYPMGDTA
ncbi:MULTISPECIES: DUF1376 domain-containing protein [unclassified Mesorhizobium]|uniref:YdaU family protein n=1 Tax=unclassified Mesorhizobium TaxID=325217 RepID=UPI0003CECDCF|nr:MULTISPECIES: DUF1376 domain-containing protein [unclassified Mesorhizobium]ESX29953.1 hypothetical protein X765_13270 [Mesorhizobium sp. LSHC440B00]ESX35529.1 hypothetical protein X763_17600 [Mesorhizobium sp. LSHC432A00]ESX41943.1 hypothetical protein X764_13875 [Mesorhizobium sp. LSHC440A00]WJI55103.1 DUF1376 domain-containing protein [Mesorhizobium sp. C432A]